MHIYLNASEIAGLINKNKYNPQEDIIYNILCRVKKEKNELDNNKLRIINKDELIELLLLFQQSELLDNASCLKYKETIKNSKTDDVSDLSKVILNKVSETSIKTQNTDESKKMQTKIEKNIKKVIEDTKEYNFNIDNHLIKPLQFGLSYDQFDNLELNKKCVSFYKKIYPELNKINNINNTSSSKIKIGFISDYLTDHTIGKLFKGIILRLDQKKFDVIVFHTEKTKKGIILNQLQDAENNGLIRNCFLPSNFNEKQKIILKESLSILFYPEIGLSLELYYLSFIKLANYQITSWGHPETTGNSSIDYFLTSKLIETGEAQKNFSEKLIHLDYLPMYYYTPLIKNKIDKTELSRNNIYSCPQTLQKLHPNFDSIIGKIFAQDSKAEIYFIKDANNILFKKLIERFKKNKKIDLERIKFLDGLSWEDYINHCGKASVLLDPIYYGAGNSFYESVFYGTPTVTMPTKYTKSRLVLGAYNQIDISNLDFNPITKSVDEYVEKAIEISSNKNLYDLKQNIQQRAKKNLYERVEVIKNFEQVFEDIVH